MHLAALDEQLGELLLGQLPARLVSPRSFWIAASWSPGSSVIGVPSWTKFSSAASDAPGTDERQPDRSV